MRGLFGVIGSKGKVSNLSVVGLDVKAGAEKAGGLAAVNHGTVTNCSSGCTTSTGTKISKNGKTISISSLHSKIRGNLAGGLVAYNDGTIRNVRSNALISAQGAGGITGENKGTVQNISSMGKVKGTKAAGGFAAVNSGTMKYGYSCGHCNRKKSRRPFWNKYNCKICKSLVCKEPETRMPGSER